MNHSKNMAAAVGSSREAKITLVGGPTVLLELGGFRILTDPTFDPPGSYDQAGVTLYKTAFPGLTAETVGQIDAVLLSHDQHADNLDHGGRQFLPRARQVLTTTAAAGRLAKNAIGLDAWKEIHLEQPNGDRLFVTATPARHGPPGIEPITGEVTGFIIGIDRPGDAIYVTGDTVWYEGVAEVARRFDPKIVILFAGAAKPRGPFHVTMDNNDALETANAFPNAQIIAIHNEGWKHFTEGARGIEDSFRILGYGARFQQLEVGQSISLAI